MAVASFELSIAILPARLTLTKGPTLVCAARYPRRSRHHVISVPGVLSSGSGMICGCCRSPCSARQHVDERLQGVGRRGSARPSRLLDLAREGIQDRRVRCSPRPGAKTRPLAGAMPERPCAAALARYGRESAHDPPGAHHASAHTSGSPTRTRGFDVDLKKTCATRFRHVSRPDQFSTSTSLRLGDLGPARGVATPLAGRRGSSRMIWQDCGRASAGCSR